MKDNKTLWVVVGGAFFFWACILVTTYGEKQERLHCTLECAPNQAHLVTNYREPDLCYCLIGSEWKIHFQEPTNDQP